MFEQDGYLTNTDIAPKVMIIDDNIENTRLLERILHINGYSKIKSICDSRLVLDAFKTWQPDIILLDLLMPHLNGLDILDEISRIKNRNYLPVIMITADDNQENRIKALNMGANDYIGKPFNAQELIARIRNLTNLKTSMDQAISTEAAFLQAQIKPHFLYNTLNTISSFCDTDPGRASSLIDDFSKYLRQSFDLKSLKFFVPVERELELVQSFVEIQKARFGERIQFSIRQIDNMHFSLPPLCIQPLVENAIRHGLKSREHIGIILSFEEIQNSVCVCVKDDGVGIDEKALDGLLNRSDGKGIGLWNIDARLKRSYGKGLSIESVTGQGTTISFLIPREDEHDSRNHC